MIWNHVSNKSVTKFGRMTFLTEIKVEPTTVRKQKFTRLEFDQWSLSHDQEALEVPWDESVGQRLVLEAWNHRQKIQINRFAKTDSTSGNEATYTFRPRCESPTPWSLASHENGGKKCSEIGFVWWSLLIWDFSFRSGIITLEQIMSSSTWWLDSFLTKMSSVMSSLDKGKV